MTNTTFFIIDLVLGVFFLMVTIGSFNRGYLTINGKIRYTKLYHSSITLFTGILTIIAFIAAIKAIQS